MLLAEDTTPASLEQALQAVGAELPPGGTADPQGCAKRLARQFLMSTAADPTACFRVFKDGLALLEPAPDHQRARELFGFIRSLWVQPGDAAPLQRVRQHPRPLALNGRLLGWRDEELGTECYTLRRFIERAWPESGADTFITVPLAASDSLGTVKDEIHGRVLGRAPLPPGPNPQAGLDHAVNRDGRTIVLLVPANPDHGGLPDPAVVRDLTGLFGTFDHLLVVIDLGEARPVLPPSIHPAQPRLDDPDEYQAFFGCEYDSLLGERATKTFLDQKYGNQP